MIMNCQGFSRLIPLCLYGEAPDKVRREMEEHAASCAACRVDLAAMAETVAFLKKSAPRFSAEELSALRLRILEETSRIVPVPRLSFARRLFTPIFISPVFRFVPAAAALAAAVFLLIRRPSEKALEPPGTAEPPAAAEPAVSGILAMADYIEAESQEVADVCREIDDLNARCSSEPPAESGVSLPLDESGLMV
jgi:hypothetical protein